MYESPIGLFYQETAPKISEGIDSLICEAVLNVGVNVDKEELLKALKYDRGQYEKGYADGIARTTPQGTWIPVSENLPEDMQRVLIWFEYYRYGDFNCMYQTYGFGYTCDGKWSPFINGETGWRDYRVIAWQPLPEPYENCGTQMNGGEDHD